MATRGRKPKPTALKVLEGNPGKRPMNMNEPVPPKGTVKCPAWLEPEAKKEWKRLASSLEAMGGPDGLCGLLSGVCALEGGGGVHIQARSHLSDAQRIYTAGAACIHRSAEPQDHAELLLGVRPDPGDPRAHHRWRRRAGGRRGRPDGASAQGRLEG